MYLPINGVLVGVATVGPLETVVERRPPDLETAVFRDATVGPMERVVERRPPDLETAVFGDK